MMYEELVKQLRNEAIQWCANCVYKSEESHICHAPEEPSCDIRDRLEAADAIEELLKAAKAMHTWIFLNTGDEQAAYDECGLTDEMNAALGYGDRYIVEPPKEEET